MKGNDVADMSTTDLMAAADETVRTFLAHHGRFLVIVGELDRRRAYEDEGAANLPTWIAERYGVAQASARSWAKVAAGLWDTPHLAAAMAEGELSFDKVRAVAPIATPDNDAELRHQARHCTVRQLRDLTARARTAPKPDEGARYVRLNDDTHTIAAKLPADEYARCRRTLVDAAKAIPSDGEVPWDDRLADAFVLQVGSRTGSSTTPSGGDTMVVLHAPLSTVLDDDRELTALGGELEHAGLLSVESVRRIACDATVVLSLDTDAGHSMYEGRSLRRPSPTQRREIFRRDRHCRFPGCTNATFTAAHHLTEWARGGLTDLPNLLLLCHLHHHTIHKKGWQVEGNANEKLIFRGPSGRDLISYPSPQWGSGRSGDG
ncbi:MAG TPA: DUF222 domain-containing protein [Acidimicrobiales bacterium]|jgi:hypothetical protein